MSETKGATDNGEPAYISYHDGLAGLFASPAPSTAGSIDSREEVHSCDEWDLFADTGVGQGEATDSENSTDDQSEKEDKPGTSCVPDKQASNAECASPSSSCVATDGVNCVPSAVAPCEESADTGVHRRLQVVVRVRPPFSPQGKVVVTSGEKEGTSLCVQSTTTQGTCSTVTECTFDRVFMGDATQEDVFAAIEPSVQACLEGYNATVFTYGQTGTGKTHTLFGRDLDSSTDNGAIMVKSTWGIVPRTLSYFLNQAASLKQNCQVELHLSFLQIYNDHLFDLLTDRMRQKPLLLREQPTMEGTTSVTVRGLSSEKITSFSNAMQIIHQGHTNRCVRETESNHSSSRSHAIVQLNVTTLNGEGQAVRRARLNLVDLAGSEKWNTDMEMEDAHSQELKNINTSLSALGNCIAALTETGRKHIPYRDSTLTRVLQDSFGGNTQSCLIATINATHQACDETIRTLQFADRARSVMQTIRVNKVADGLTELLMAKIQIVKLRERLESEQRRRHEIRVKEHQTMQRDFQDILKGKDKEITKLTRDNVVFQRWRDEDVKKIRALESRVKDLEHQIDTSDSKNIENATESQESKRQNSSIPAMRKTQSRANLTRAGSDSGAAPRTYKQVLERYALDSSKEQVKTAQTSKIENDPAHDATSQGEDSIDTQPVPSQMNQKPSWKAPVTHRSHENTAPLDSTKNSWTYPNTAATCSSNTEWTSSLQASKSTPTILTQQQESNKNRIDLSLVNGYSSFVSRQEAVSLVKNASTGSMKSPVCAPIISTSISTIEPCSKHKLAGCMLCSAGDNFRQPQAPTRQPTKELITSTMASNSPEVNRKPQDGPCERHQLLRCFICMKNSTTTSSNAHVTAASATSGPSSYPASSASGINNLGYHNSRTQSETQSKCALHSLANCILCAGVKAMTRKVLAPSPKASPVNIVAELDTRSAIRAEERDLDRYRRYTLDERILSYKVQSKLVNQW